MDDSPFFVKYDAQNSKALIYRIEKNMPYELKKLGYKQAPQIFDVCDNVVQGLKGHFDEYEQEQIQQDFEIERARMARLKEPECFWKAEISNIQNAINDVSFQIPFIVSPTSKAWRSVEALRRDIVWIQKALTTLRQLTKAKKEQICRNLVADNQGTKIPTYIQNKIDPNHKKSKPKLKKTTKKVDIPKEE